jgi:hypothetical protein
MNYSRLICVKEVVCVAHKRLTMSETRKREMNLSSFFCSFFYFFICFLCFLFLIGVVKKVYLYAERVGYCITTRINKRRR